MIMRGEQRIELKVSVCNPVYWLIQEMPCIQMGKNGQPTNGFQAPAFSKVHWAQNKPIAETI